MTEEWKSIGIIKGIDFTGLYEVSNLGRVKSLNYCGRGVKKILKQRVNKTGYFSVNLQTKGKRSFCRINRLVAYAFLGLDIDNVEMCACHKDDNPSNNNKNNLFIGTQLDNIKDRHKKGRDGKAMLGKFGILHHLSKQVNQLDLDGNFIKTWGSTREAENGYGIGKGAISRVCKGRYGFKTAGGFKWEYTSP